MNTIEHVDASTEKSKYPNCFKVVTPGRTYVISAPTQSEMNKWIDLIKDTKLKYLQAKGIARSQSNTELDGKGLHDLEALLSGIESKMQEEIKVLLDDCSREKDLILEELMTREVRELLENARKDRELVQYELSKRRQK